MNIIPIVGYKLSAKVGFAEILDPEVTNKQRFLIPALSGLGLGVLAIIQDNIFSRSHTLGPTIHPPFPTSIFAAYYLRKYDYLASAGVHFWTEIVWHVIWGIL